MGQQYNGLVSCREFREHISQDRLPLPLVRDPRDGGWDRNEATLLATHAFANRVHGIMSMSQPDRPAIKASQRADTPSDRRWRKFGASNVGNIPSVCFVSRSPPRITCPQPINVMGNLGLISFQQVSKRDIRKSREEIVEVAGVVLNGARGLPLSDELLNESPRSWVLSHQGATDPVHIGHISTALCMRSNVLLFYSVYHKQSLLTANLFGTPIPQYTAEAILAWKAVRPKNQPLLQDRKTGKLTEYLFQYRRKMIGEAYITDHLIPLLCKAAGLTSELGKPYKDAIGPITSHRARSSTAYYLKAMGMTPYDIGKLLGHTNPNRTLPWYLKENLHQLGRMYRKANPLDRTVQALLDTNAAAKGEPCVFYYLTDGPEGRPRLCGNPNFRTCYHQLQCAECGAYIEPEMAEVIERRPGCLHIAVAIPLPEQLVEDLSKQEEGIPLDESPPPPPIPSPAFHFNKKVAARIEELSDQPASELEQLHMRLVALETQLAAKGKQDARNVSVRLLKQEISHLKKRVAQLEQANEEVDNSF